MLPEQMYERVLRTCLGVLFPQVQRLTKLFEEPDPTNEAWRAEVRTSIESLVVGITAVPLFEQRPAPIHLVVVDGMVVAVARACTMPELRSSDILHNLSSALTQLTSLQRQLHAASIE